VTAVLTMRRLQVLAKAAEGLTDEQIGADLGISVNSVKTHLRFVYDALGVQARAAAATVALTRGLLEAREDDTGQLVVTALSAEERRHRRLVLDLAQDLITRTENQVLLGMVRAKVRGAA